jgi:hypothetical protein
MNKDKRKGPARGPKSIVQLNKGGIQLPDDAPLSINPGETYPVEIEMLRTGVYQYWWREIKLGRQQLQQIVDNRNAGRPHTPLSFDLDHNPGSVGAVAWLDDADDALYIRNKTYTDPDGVARTCYVLVGKVNLNSLGYALVKDRRYKFFSVEMALQYQSQEKVRRSRQISPEDDTSEYEMEDPKGYCLLSGALTNRPFIPDLAPISLSVDGAAPVEMSGLVGIDDGSDFVTFVRENKKSSKPKGAAKASDPGDEEEGDEDEMPDLEPEPGDDEDEEYSDVAASEPINPPIGNDLNNPPVNLSKNDIDPLATPAEEKEDKMKFMQLFVTLSALATPAEQLAKMDELSATFSTDVEDQKQIAGYRKMLELSIANDRLAREQTAKASMLQTEKARLESEQVELRKKAMENAQLSYQQSIDLFAQALRTDGHHEAPIKAMSELLLSVHPDAHTLKFSTVTGDKQFELKDLAKAIFDSLPNEARLGKPVDETKVAEVTPVAAPTPEQVKASEVTPLDPSKPDTFRTRFSAEQQTQMFSANRQWLEELYGQKFSQASEIPVSFWQRCDDKGNFQKKVLAPVAPQQAAPTGEPPVKASSLKGRPAEPGINPWY